MGILSWKCALFPQSRVSEPAHHSEAPVLETSERPAAATSEVFAGVISSLGGPVAEIFEHHVVGTSEDPGWGIFSVWQQGKAWRQGSSTV